MDDETSPLFCDPLHSEDYTYSILSKTLTKKQQPTSAQVAGAANQVRGAESASTAAHKAVHKGTWRGSGASRKSTSAGQSSAASMTKEGSREVCPGTYEEEGVEQEGGEQEMEDNEGLEHDKSTVDCAA